MLSHWPIRVKFLIGLGLLLSLVAILSSSGLYTTYAYRSLAKSLSWRASELPLAAELSRQVDDLQNRISELRGLQAGRFPAREADRTPLRVRMIRDEFRADLGEVEDTLARYRDQLEHNVPIKSKIADTHPEWSTISKFEAALMRLRRSDEDEDWMLDGVKVGRLEAQLRDLQLLAAELPSHLYHRMATLADEVRNQYRTLIVGTWITTASALLIFILFVKLFYQWVFVPLRILIEGSREVASGHFGHRIHLQADDEMAELAEALNAMTARFQAIRDDLDRQVQERTKQVVRSEQLAAVGFLAAGVAHEINNPLASIALCAESLEGRVREALDSGDPEHAVIANYLEMIQSEAFRCKEITERLLDFSRTGQATRQDTDLVELVRGVIDMVHPLGKHRQKQIELIARPPVIAQVNPQEMKQVVLNLLTNALDSVEAGGTVWVELGTGEGAVELTVRDNGCGMTPEVLDHVFEPFFTRRREGQGTGLGLSITYRIIADHGGEIEAESPGPGQGATFRVRLPLAESHKENRHQHRAA